jgi:hypothetical protein
MRIRHQRSSEVIRGHQRSSEVIRRQSEAILTWCILIVYTTPDKETAPVLHHDEPRARRGRRAALLRRIPTAGRGVEGPQIAILDADVAELLDLRLVFMRVELLHGHLMREAIRLMREAIRLMREAIRLIREAIRLMREAIRLMREAIRLMREAIRLMREAIRLMREAIRLIREAIRLMREAIRLMREAIRLMREAIRLMRAWPPSS